MENRRRGGSCLLCYLLFIIHHHIITTTTTSCSRTRLRGRSPSPPLLLVVAAKVKRRRLPHHHQVQEVGLLLNLLQDSSFDSTCAIDRSSERVGVGQEGLPYRTLPVQFSSVQFLPDLFFRITFRCRIPKRVVLNNKYPPEANQEHRTIRVRVRVRVRVRATLEQTESHTQLADADSLAVPILK